jgi:MFS family permease
VWARRVSRSRSLRTAPALLVSFRVLQGLGLGGEWGGAVLLAVEHAPANRRGFFGSWPQVLAPAGIVLANAAFGVVAILPQGALLTWGWRPPFLLSLILVGAGLLVRHAVPETPAFRKLHASRSHSRRGGGVLARGATTIASVWALAEPPTAADLSRVDRALPDVV